MYYINVAGVTGARQEVPSDIGDHIKRIKEYTALPVLAGFGISTPDMARQVARHADGVIVGSALVRTLADADTRQQAIENASAFVASLRHALDEERF